jgi:PilZ domain
MKSGAGAVRFEALLFKVKFEGSREYERVDLALNGRCMLPDLREFPCVTLNVSENGLAVESEAPGEVGEPVVAYIDQLGRLEGAIVRHLDNGFAITMPARDAKREKLAARVDWLMHQRLFGASDQRRLERIAPVEDRTILKTPEGGEYAAILVDISSGGAAINVETIPPIGTPVTVGRTQAHVVRHFPGGIAVAFNVA